MADIIAVTNQKGGIGKTTTTINLCAALAEKGFKVLLIEADPQGNASTALGFEDFQVTVKDVFLKVLEDETIPAEYGILHNAEGIDLLPADSELASMEYMLYEAGEKGRTVLRQYTKHIYTSYDYIFIDCPPFLGFLNVNALMAANKVIIPVVAEPLPAKGMQQLMRTIAITRKKGNEKLKIAGILFINVDYRTANTKNIIEQIREMYHDNINVFRTEIPRRIAISEAQGCGKSVLSYDKSNDASEAFRKLAAEVNG